MLALLVGDGVSLRGGSVKHHPDFWIFFRGRGAWSVLSAMAYTGHIILTRRRPHCPLRDGVLSYFAVVTNNVTYCPQGQRVCLLVEGAVASSSLRKSLASCVGEDVISLLGRDAVR